MKKKILVVCMGALVLLFGIQVFMECLFTDRLQEMTAAMAETESAVRLPEIYALFGVDQEEGDLGRSDCILLVSLDAQGDLRLCSLARDTLVTMPGEGNEIKLGHAYALGGPELAMETINENFGLDIQKYVSVNFSQMEELVELLGGVEVPLTQAEWEYLGLPKPYLGTRRLNGEEALCYSRIRAIDSDDMRTGRQRLLLMGMLNQLRKCPRGELPGLVAAGMKMCRTNVDILTAMHLGKQVLDHRPDTHTMALPGDSVPAWGGVRRDGVWYYVYDLHEAGEQLEHFFFPESAQ